TLVALDASGHAMLAKLSGNLSFSVGQTVRLSAALDDIHLFQNSTDTRLGAPDLAVHFAAQSLGQPSETTQ
ncbi:MAG: hypothetical protein AAFS08_17750, partial [Pseudomonadota bacterium]